MSLDLDEMLAVTPETKQLTRLGEEVTPSALPPSQAQTPNIDYYPELGMAGFSHITDGSSCQSGLTYAEAEAKALEIGARLPTLKEVLWGVAKGTGCGFDSELIWTQDTSDVAGERYVINGAGDETTLASLPETDVASVRFVMDYKAPLTMETTGTPELDEVLTRIQANTDNRLAGLGLQEIIHMNHGFAEGDALTYGTNVYRRATVDDVVAGGVAQVLDEDRYVFAPLYTPAESSIFGGSKGRLFLNADSLGTLSLTPADAYRVAALALGDGTGVFIHQDRQTVDNELLKADKYLYLNLFYTLDNTRIISSADDNSIFVDGVLETTLGRNGEVTLNSLPLGTVITSKAPLQIISGAYDGGSNTAETLEWATRDHAGTKFAVQCTRNAPHRIGLYAFEDSTVTILINGAVSEVVNVTQDSSLSRIYTEHVNLVIESTGLVAVAKASLRQDHAVLSPLSRDAIGYASGSLYLIAEQNAAMTLRSVDAETNLSVQKGVRANTTFATGSLYQGSPIRVTSDTPFMGHSTGDANGGQMAIAQPIAHARDSFIVPVDLDYLAMASLHGAVVTLTPPANTAIQGYAVDEVVTVTLTNAGTIEGAPYSGYIGSGLGSNATVIIPKGTEVVADQPILVWIQAPASSAAYDGSLGYQDEVALMGYWADAPFYNDYSGYTSTTDTAVKVLSGTTSDTDGGQTLIPTGLDPQSILSVTAVVTHDTNGKIPPNVAALNGTMGGYEYEAHINATGDLFVLNLNTGNSSNILSKPFKGTITYQV